MKKTIFDDVETVFKDLTLKNFFDEVELPIEDRVILSPEMSKLIREEIYKEIANIPIGKMVSQIMAKEIERRTKENELLKTMVNTEISKAKETVENEVKSIKEKWEDFSEKIRKKFDDIKNDVMTIHGKQWFQFGGFSPQFNDLNIGDPATNGSWRIVRNGTELSVQRRESGSWVEKASFLP